jgi:spoIIIJ-associated protein
MIDEVIAEGPSVEDALDVALEQMGIQQDAIDYEVLVEPSRGLFKSASTIAKVRVWLRPDAIPTEVDADGDYVDEIQDARVLEDAELSDEELDAIADAGAEAIRAILGSLGIEGGIDEYEGDEGEIILDITGDDLAVLIGRHGRTLDALQVLVSTITNR